MRIDQLTFTRFVAAFFILVYHFGKKTFPFNWEKAYMFIKQTNVGVSYFYILSGYVMILAYHNRENKKIDTLEYYKNRFARVYPIYFIALLLSVIFIVFKKEQVSYIALLLDFSALQSWIPSYALEINYTAWSISVEVFFFIVFPFLFNRLYLKNSLFNLSVIGIFFWAITQIVFQLLYTSAFYKGYPSSSHELLYYHPAFHLNEFIAGNIAGLFYMRVLAGKGYDKNYDFLVILAVAILIVCMSHPFLNFHDGFLAIVFVPFLILLSLNNGLITKIFSRRGPVLLGEISYGFYILQIPVFSVCKFIYLKLGVNQKNFPLFYFGFAALLIASYLSYVCIEKPLRIWIKGIGKST